MGRAIRILLCLPPVWLASAAVVLSGLSRVFESAIVAEHLAFYVIGGMVVFMLGLITGLAIRR